MLATDRWNIDQSDGSSARFTYTEDPNYGPYLESVNGLAGSDKDRTYWELLVRTPDGQLIRPDVGQFTASTSLISVVFSQSLTCCRLCRYRMLYSKSKRKNHPEFYQMVMKQQQVWNQNQHSNNQCLEKRCHKSIKLVCRRCLYTFTVRHAHPGWLNWSGYTGKSGEKVLLCGKNGPSNNSYKQLSSVQVFVKSFNVISRTQHIC